MQIRHPIKKNYIYFIILSRDMPTNERKNVEIDQNDTEIH